MRSIVARTRGTQHGFIRRIVSPGDLGETVKPFVFLDFVHGRVEPGSGFGFHPHSGIATLTYSLDADIAYEDTAGQNGTVEATGLEWMRAGGGTWHRGNIYPRGPTVTAFQLWLALPPSLESGPAEGLYIPPGDVPQVGNTRVLLGTYEGRTNPIPAPSPLVYLDLVLAAGEAWRYAPPEGHTVAWAMVYAGAARVAGEALSDTFVALDPSTGEIAVDAVTDARVLVGCGRPHAHPLVLGSHSVHTDPLALSRGVARIREVGATLRREGRL